MLFKRSNGFEHESFLALFQVEGSNMRMFLLTLMLAVSLHGYGQVGKLLPYQTFVDSTGNVVIPFKVLDEHGRPISNLDERVLSVQENGKQIHNFNVSYAIPPLFDKNFVVLALDVSGSMVRDQRLERMKAAASALIQTMNDDDYCAIISFSSHATVHTGFTSNKQQLEEIILALKAGGGTAIYDAVLQALHLLAAQAHNASKILLLITDGQEDGERFFSFDEIIPRIQSMNNLSIHAFDLNRRKDANNLRKLSTVGSGTYTYDPSPEKVFKSFEQFFDNFRKAYVLSYPTNPYAKPQVHNVVVTVSFGDRSNSFETSYETIAPVVDMTPYYLTVLIVALLAMVGVIILIDRKRQQKSGSQTSISTYDTTFNEQIVNDRTSYSEKSSPRPLNLLQTLEPSTDHIPPDRTVVQSSIHRGKETVLAYLATQSRDRGREVFTIDEDEIFIGRGTECKVQFSGEEVSRFHAKLRREQEGFVLYDLGSANGTSVNGELVQKKPLKDGDIIKIGTNQVTFKEIR